MSEKGGKGKGDSAIFVQGVIWGVPKQKNLFLKMCINRLE
jgi:hypothetical protein